jgi:signal transduction histidine kinase
MRRLAVTAVPATLLVLMAALRIADLKTTRAEVLRTGETRAINLAQITSSYLGEAFASVDASLRQLVLYAGRIGGPEAPDSDWLPSLAAARAGLPVGAISITDRNGVIRHSTQPLIVGQSRRDETTVRALMAATDDVLIAGAPFRTLNPAPGTPRFIIPIGRKIVDRDGRMSGTVIASFIPAAAKEFLRSVDVGQRGVVWVFHPEGVLLYEEPSSVDHTGEQIRDTPLFAAARDHGTGVVRAPLGPDAAVKLTAYHARVNPSLTTAVSLDESELLTAWRTEAWRSGVLFAVLSLMLVAVLLVLAREMAARSAALGREQLARREAEVASSVKDQFLMTLSHELRTPLTAICGWASMLPLDMMDDAPRRTKAVHAIERNARVLQRLIEDLLDVSRVMVGKLPLNIEPVQIGTVAQLALETVRPAADMKGVRLKSDVQVDAGTVSGDPERLLQIVWNLLSNAVKFTPAGGEVFVDVRRLEERHVGIAVSDTGIGISLEFLPHVFERFSQEDTSPTRAHGGLGLGLSIVRTLVELHGGTIAVHSDGAGHGTRFEVILPTMSPPAVSDVPVAATITTLSRSSTSRQIPEGSP